MWYNLKILRYHTLTKFKTKDQTDKRKPNYKININKKIINQIE